MDVKIYWTVLRHWSQLVPNKVICLMTSEDIKHQLIIIIIIIILKNCCQYDYEYTCIASCLVCHCIFVVVFFFKIAFAVYMQVQKRVCQNVNDDQYSHFAHKHLNFYSWTNDYDAVVSDTGAQFRNSQFEWPSAGITQLHTLHNSHVYMYAYCTSCKSDVTWWKIYLFFRKKERL